MNDYVDKVVDDQNILIARCCTKFFNNHTPLLFS